MNHRIFVYGTLRKGEGNNGLLKGSTYLGMGVTLPEYEMYNLGHFPGVVDGGLTSIVGEVYEVDEETLRRLDRLESHPALYTRTPLTLAGDTAGMEVEMYVFNLPVKGCVKIEGGDWVERDE